MRVPKEKKYISFSEPQKIINISDIANNSASSIYETLTKSIGCTYILYIYENLNTKEKYIYSSNWEWQRLLIGKQLIHHCPYFLAGFKFLEQNKNKPFASIILPWYLAQPTDKKQKEVVGLRGEFNIANGISYGAKGHGIREILGIGGDITEKDFYRSFMCNKFSLGYILDSIRNTILTATITDKIIKNTSKKIH